MVRRRYHSDAVIHYVPSVLTSSSVTARAVLSKTKLVTVMIRGYPVGASRCGLPIWVRPQMSVDTDGDTQTPCTVVLFSSMGHWGDVLEYAEAGK